MKQESLIKNSIVGINTLCITRASTSLTILDLLLTFLGISSKSKLKKDHSKHIFKIIWLDASVFVGSLIRFLLFDLPVTESAKFPKVWFSALYYVSLAKSSILSAAPFVVMFMPYNTLWSIIKIAGLGLTDHSLVELDIESE